MDKTREIINYIINYFQCNYSNRELGKVKLVKILWFADREFMHLYYKQLTNLEYRKMPYGPMPTKIDSILKAMQKDNIIKMFKIEKIGGYTQESFLCLKEPNLNNFTAQEINILDKIINALHDKTAQEISELTHDELWESINQGEIMPIESVFLQDIIPATKADINATD